MIKSRCLFNFLQGISTYLLKFTFVFTFILTGPWYSNQYTALAQESEKQSRSAEETTSSESTSNLNAAPTSGEEPSLNNLANSNSNSKDTSNASENQEGPSQDTIAKVSNSGSSLAFNPLFEKGVALTQDKKWNEAIEQFQAVLKLDPHHVPSLVNLGISYYEINKKGFSLAYFKKAKTINPSFSAANQALKFLKTKIELKEIPHEIKMQDSFMVSFITPFSLNSFLFFFAICTFASAWLWIDFGAQVKDLKKTRRRLQEFPALKIIVLLFWILAGTGLAFKYFDLKIPRGIIVVEKAPVFAAPKPESVSLLDLYEGHEVEILQRSDSWVQVSYPGTPAGWIPIDQILQVSGHEP